MWSNDDSLQRVRIQPFFGLRVWGGKHWEDPDKRVSSQGFGYFLFKHYPKGKLSSNLPPIGARVLGCLTKSVSG